MNSQGPFSPSSQAGSDWSGIRHYQSKPPGPSTTGRGNLITPPVSGSSNGMNGPIPNGMNGFNGRPGDFRGNPSPPNSIARSSNGTQVSNDAQRRKQAMLEDTLAQHYVILKRYLANSPRDEQLDGKPNRARDKLIRLSPIQFQELSTDVYDELLRRQSAAQRPPNGSPITPECLQPKENFHPKRNQARQKLSTLPPPRFRALAVDVFFELERRVPRFAAGDIGRGGSPANSMRGPPSRTGTPLGGMRPGSRDQARRPGPGSRQGSLGGQVFAGLGIPGIGSQDDYNRPTQKSSQSNTIVPNKSYLVEDDDDAENDSLYGLDKRDTSNTNRSYGGNEKIMADYQNQVDELQGKIGNLEKQVRDKDEIVEKLESSQKTRDLETAEVSTFVMV